MNTTSVLSRLCVIALAAALGSTFLGCEKKEEKAKDDDSAKEEKDDKGDDDDDDDDDKKKKKKGDEADDDDDDDDDDGKDEPEADDDDDDDDDDDELDEELDEEDPLAELGEDDTVEVVQYADMTPMSGTVRLKKRFTVKNDIIPEAKTLTNLAPGTLIDLKGNHKNFMLIDWPSGVGEMAPGWIDVANVNDKRITLVQGAQVVEAKKKQDARLKTREEKIKKREEELAKKEAELAKKEGKAPPPPTKKKKGRPKILLKAAGAK